VQTKDDGKHAILPVAERSDHARMPVTMPRDSDGKMRRGGSNAARLQPHHPVDERGRLHGAPELEPFAEQRIAAKIRVEFTNAKEKRRCRKRSPTATRKRPGRALKSGIDRICSFPGPRQQFVEAVDRMSFNHAGENITQIGVWLDAVQLRCLDQRTDRCPPDTATIAAREQMILAPEGHRTDRTFDGIGVELNAAVVQKSGQAVPSGKRVAHGLGKRAAAGDARQLLLQPDAECIDNRLRSRLSGRKTIRRRPTSDFGFNGIKFTDPAQGFLGKRCIGRLGDFIKLAPRVRPARGKDDVALAGQPFEPGIAVDVENALEVLEMRRRALGLSVRCEQIDSCRRLGSRPRSLLTCVDPKTSSLRASATRIEHRDRRIVGEEMILGKEVLAQSLVQGFEPPAGTADPTGERRTAEIDTVPGEDLRLPVERRVIAIFADEHLGEQCRRCEPASNWAFRRRCLYHFIADRHAYFGRVVRITRSLAGTQSSISDSLSPIRCIVPPQHGQASLGTSSKISSRGR
jgi:hypothetical protein